MFPSQISPYICLDSNNPNLPTMREFEAVNTESSENHSTSSIISSSSLTNQPSKFKGISQWYEENQPMAEEEVRHLIDEKPENVFEALKERI